jgi:hypothetical protein
MSDQVPNHIDKSVVNTPLSVDGHIFGTPFEFIDSKDGASKTYKVGWITGDVKAAFEEHMFALAVDTTSKMRAAMTGEGEYQSALTKLLDDKLSGWYAIESPTGARFIGTTNGIGWLVCALFSRDGKPIEHNDAIDLLVRRQDEMTTMIRHILHESIPAIKSAAKRQAAMEAERKAEAAATGGTPDPNLQTPVPPA